MNEDYLARLKGLPEAIQRQILSDVQAHERQYRAVETPDGFVLEAAFAVPDDGENGGIEWRRVADRIQIIRHAFPEETE